MRKCDMSTNKLKIGEFSRLCHVTTRALRHYEEIGLLVPEIIDRQTGYRYYSIGQYQKMQGILSLKEMGYSLAEILDLYEDECHSPEIESLEQKIKECEAVIRKLEGRRQQLQTVLDSRKQLKTMEDFYFESLPAITVASYRGKLSSYSELGRLCCETIGPEMLRLGCECPEPGYCYTIEHGEYRPTDIDIEYCELVKEKRKDSSLIKFKDIPAVPRAFCLKAYGPYERLHESYARIFEKIEAEGWKITDAPRAVYVDGIWNQEDPEKWLTIIQVPVSD